MTGLGGFDGLMPATSVGPAAPISPDCRTIPITLRAYEWGRLATIADHRDVVVADLIADAVRLILGADPDRLAELETELTRVRHKRSGAKRWVLE